MNTFVEVRIGKIEKPCACGKCPAWMKDSIGKFVLRVYFAGHQRFFGPFETEAEAERQMHPIMTNLHTSGELAKLMRQNSPHLH